MKGTSAIGQSSGLETNTLSEWPDDNSGTESIQTTIVRTGTYAGSYQTANTTTNQRWRNSGTSVSYTGTGGYIHMLGWVNGSSTNCRAAVGLYNATAGSQVGSGAITTLGSSGTWIRFTHNVATATGTNSYQPTCNNRSVTGTITNYWDDFIIYSSTNTTTDVTAPSAASTFTNGTIASNSIQFSWTNGSDGGTNPTGIQNTMILRTINTGASAPSLNAQGVYSTGGGSTGPNTVSSWTVISTSISSGATSYTDNTVSASTSYKYAVIHRDLAYNYSTALVSSTITTPSASGPQEIDVESPTGTAIVNGGSRASFGSFQWGTNNDFTFRVKNTGGTALSVSSIAFSGTHSGDFSLVSAPTFPVTVSAGGQQDFTVRFTPGGIGSRTGTITFNNDDSDEGTYAIGISGTGLANTESDIADNTTYASSTPEFNINPEYISFTSNDGTSSSGKIIAMKIKIRDGGSDFADSDNLNTVLTDLTLSVKNTSGTDRGTYIKKAVLTGTGGAVISDGTVGAGTITFAGMSGSSVTCNDADASGKDLHLRISFNEANVTDNEKLVFKITTAAASGSGSIFAAADAGGAQTDNSTGNDRNRIEVVADRLGFVQQPSNTAANSSMSPAPTVEAKDANNKRDLDYVTTISITSSGTLNTSPINVSPSSGLATFSSVIHTAQGSGLTLSATSGSLTGTTSNTFNITLTSATTDYFRSKADGSWGSTSTWESSPDSSSWIDATLTPNQAANTISIFDVVTIDASITADRIMVKNGGTLLYSGGNTVDFTLNDGTGTDLIIENGGVFQLDNTAQALYYEDGTVLVKTGGMIEALHNGGGESDGYANNEWVNNNAVPYEDLITWEHGSIFYYNDNTVFSTSGTSGIDIFPNNSASSDIAIFRFNGAASNHGGSQNFRIFGVLELDAGSTLTLQSAGLKVFKNGIRGNGNLVQLSSSGQFQITGTAELDGTGSITLSTNGMLLASTSTTTLEANKTINSGGIIVSGTFDLTDKAISGTYTAFTMSGSSAYLKTAHANGLRSSTGALQNNSATYNLSATGTTIEYNRIGDQTVTNNDYQRLIMRGAGNKTMAGNTNIFGDLEWNDLNGMAVLKCGSYTLAVFGNWLNNSLGEFDAGTGIVYFGSTSNTRTIADANNFNTLRTYGTVNVTSGTQNVYDHLELATNSTFNTGGNLVLKSTSSKTAYIDDFSSGLLGTLSGNLTIERYIPSTSNGNIFHYIGALTGGDASKWNDDFGNAATATDMTFVTPTADCSPTQLESTSAYGSLFTYHESNVSNCYLKGWAVRTTGASTPRGTGFSARVSSGVVLDETGAYSKTDVTLSGLSITSGNTHANSKGFHLVANPFFSPLQWSSVTGTNLYGTAYRYNPNTGTYGTYNNISGSGIFSTNEAFIIRGNDLGQSSYSITFPASARTTGSNSTLLRQQQGYAYGLKIKVEANSRADEALIAFDNLFTDQSDNGYDAVKLLSSAGVPSLYVHDVQSIRHCILALNENTQLAAIPLGVIFQHSGTHVFTFDDISTFPSTALIHLEDLQTGTWTDLRQQNSYAFTAAIGDIPDRFLLHFTPPVHFNFEDATCAGNDGQISLMIPEGVEWSYIIRNEQGVTIARQTSIAGLSIFSELPKGIYTITLIHDGNYQTTETITVNGPQQVEAGFTASAYLVEEGETVNFTNNAEGATSYEWDFGDGEIISGISEPVHVYAEEGTYTVTMRAFNDNCEDIATQHISVYKQAPTGIAGGTDGVIRVFTIGEVVLVRFVNLADEAFAAEMYNPLGTAIYRTNGTSRNDLRIVLPHQASGFYLLTLKFEHRTLNYKVLVSR